MPDSFSRQGPCQALSRTGIKMSSPRRAYFRSGRRCGRLLVSLQKNFSIHPFSGPRLFHRLLHVRRFPRIHQYPRPKSTFDSVKHLGRGMLSKYLLSCTQPASADGMHCIQHCIRVYHAAGSGTNNVAQSKSNVSVTRLSVYGKQLLQRGQYISQIRACSQQSMNALPPCTVRYPASVSRRHGTWQALAAGASEWCCFEGERTPCDTPD